MRSEFFLPDEFRGLGEEIPAKDMVMAAMSDRLLDGPTKVKGETDTYRITFIDDDGEEKDARVIIDRDHPYRAKDEPVLLVERDVIYYNAPMPRTMPAWDLMVPTDVRCLQSARRFWVRDFLDIREVRSFWDRAIFNTMSEDDYRVLRDHVEKTRGGRSAEPQDAVDASRDVELPKSKIEARSDLIPVYYEYCYEDTDGDGVPESIIRCVTNVRKPMLLMRQRLEYLYPHGRRPFSDWHFLPVDHRYYGMGIPEMLEGIQREGNAFYQARSDAVEIMSRPAGMYEAFSGLAPVGSEFRPAVEGAGWD
jgi:hypothetical protein